MNTKNIKRKILKDRKFPDAEQISKRRNFDHISKDYSMIKKLMLKKIALWSASVITVAAVVTTIYLNNKDVPKPEAQTGQVMHTEKTVPFVQSPLPGKEMKFSSYQVSARNGGTITHSTGSVITIPPNAFTRMNGMPVGDSVEVKYREFHNPLDIFLSGIPMGYDSAGTKYNLESAGMLEILAYDGNEMLKLNKETPVEITMASANDEDRFNLYQLDTIKNNWVYKGRDKVILPGERKLPTNKKIKNESLNENVSLVKPELSDSKKYSFKITYDKNSFPELSAYENVLFEVTDNNFKPAYFKINWDKISLSAGTEKDIYTVKLKKADTTITVNAKPVFDKEDYSKAMIKFEEKHKQASKEIEKKDAEKRSNLTKVNAGLSTYNRKNLYTAANNMASQYYSEINASRRFIIGALGIFNCDMPIPLPSISLFINALKKSGDDPKQPSYSTIYMVEKGKNTVFRFAKNEPVKFNPRAEKIIWTVTDENRELAFFQPADFDKLSEGKQINLVPVIEKNQEMALNKIKKFLE
jgi:flagellar basal body-associated protein FliL